MYIKKIGKDSWLKIRKTFFLKGYMIEKSQANPETTALKIRAFRANDTRRQASRQKIQVIDRKKETK